MEAKAARLSFAGLAHDTRLAIFRQLVPAGPEGLPAGTLGERLNLAPATLSFHLKELRHAGLVSQRRMGRALYYAADFTAINELLAFLTENCCEGAPCLPAVTGENTPAPAVHAPQSHKRARRT